MQARQTNKFIEIPINMGTVPNFEVRLGYPKIFNFFVGEKGKLYSTPWLDQIETPEFEIENVRAVIQTNFGVGYYLAVITDHLIRVDFLGNVKILAEIKYNGMSVQMAENLQNQVGIVDGQNFYVYDQNTELFQLMGETNGFSYKTPISITVLNSIAIVLDKDTGGWAISDPNQMLNFPPLDTVAKISASLTQASSLQTLDDNLYIFGTTGVERWVPNSGNNPYLFPFAKDNNFRVDFGSLSVNGTQRGFNEIFFLSSKFVPMRLTVKGSEDIAEPGFAKIIASYIDRESAETSFYTYLDNYFFHMYFPISKISWVYNTDSKTWANVDDHISASVPRQNIVGTDTGLFRLTNDKAFAVSKFREFQSDLIENYEGTEAYRNLLNAIECKIIQGFIQSSYDEPQHLNLKISKDAEEWGNTVIAYIGNTGERNARTIWRCNIASPKFVVNIQYQGSYNLTIDKITAILK